MRRGSDARHQVLADGKPKNPAADHAFVGRLVGPQTKKQGTHGNVADWSQAEISYTHPPLMVRACTAISFTI